MKHAMSRLRRCLPAWLAAAVVLWPALAMAAAPTPPGLRKTSPVWLGYAVMFLLVLVVMVISLMPSKRSHQD